MSNATNAAGTTQSTQELILLNILASPHNQRKRRHCVVRCPSRHINLNCRNKVSWLTPQNAYWAFRGDYPSRLTAFAKAANMQMDTWQQRRDARDRMCTVLENLFLSGTLQIVELDKDGHEIGVVPPEEYIE